MQEDALKGTVGDSFYEIKRPGTGLSSPAELNHFCLIIKHKTLAKQSVKVSEERLDV